MSEPVLNPMDRNSPAWLKVKAHLEARLKSLREENDKEHDERKTAAIRGRIREVKLLLRLDSDVPLLESEDALFKD